MADKKERILEYCVAAGKPRTARQIVDALYPGRPQPYVNGEINQLVREGRLVRTGTRPYRVYVPGQGEHTGGTGSAPERRAVPPARQNAPAEAQTHRAGDREVRQLGHDCGKYALCLHIAGYTFDYLQELSPERTLDGRVREFYPQAAYENKENLPLSRYGAGAFCRFSLNCGNWRGVYLWVSEGEIIYIGETEDLSRRFNMEYGRISPRNCYLHGQNTNCRMNKIVLDHYQRGKTIQIYFLKTDRHKQVERELLDEIDTKYNIKNNGGAHGFRQLP